MTRDSLWDDALPGPRERLLAGADQLRVDVAVVGGGFSGLSSAYHLASMRPGLQVVVLESDHVGAGASGRNTGMLGPGVGQRLTALVSRLGPERAGALYRASVHAVECVRDLIEREAITCDLSMSGQLLLARSRADRRQLARQLTIMRQLDLPVSALDDAALDGTIRLATPKGTDDDGPAALRLPTAGVLHPGKLLAGLVEASTRRGVRVYEGARVEHIDGGSDTRPVNLRLAGGGTVVADRAVIATAGYTPGLGLLKGRVLPVQLQVMATAPLPAAALAALAWHGREGVVEARRLFSYFRLTADDRLVFGGGRPRYLWGGRTADHRGEAGALEDLHASLLATFAGRTDPAALAPSHAWTGTIGYVLDGVPVIGPLAGRHRLIHAGGWCGHGVALSLAGGAWVARLIAEERPTALASPTDLAWFRNDPPLVPFELVRWTAFRGAVAAMSLLDRIA